MSVDFEFRNKKNPLSYDGTPSYEQVKKVFKSGKIRGCKVDRTEIGRNGKESNFVVNCGGDCWLYVIDVGKYPLITMPHFDQYERADQVVKQIAKIFNCTVINDLEDSPYWSQQSYEKSKSPKKSQYGISERSIRKVLGLNRSKKKSTPPKRKVCRCKK
jgi:hypothetical protein